MIGEKNIVLIRTSYCKGLNDLVDSNISIFFSNPLSFNRRSQAEGRTRRVTSPHDDTYYFDLVTRGGADENVYNMLKSKKSFSLNLTNLRKLVE